jgi:hypothetical protein
MQPLQGRFYETHLPAGFVGFDTGLTVGLTDAVFVVLNPGPPLKLLTLFLVVFTGPLVGAGLGIVSALTLCLLAVGAFKRKKSL